MTTYLSNIVRHKCQISMLINLSHVNYICMYNTGFQVVELHVDE